MRYINTVGAAVLLSLLAACGDGPAASAPAAPKEVLKVSAGQLFKAYEDNEVATDEGMKGKTVEVSGTVQAIDKDAFDNIVINLRTSNEFMPARMQMKDSEKAAAIAMKKGVKVAVQCEKVSRIVGSPSGRDCRFVADEAPKGQKKTAG